MDDDAFETEVEKLAQGLLAVPRQSLHTLKRLLRSSESTSLAHQLEAEADAIAMSASSPEALAALRAFLAR